MGWKASDKAHCGKGLYKDDAIMYVVIWCKLLMVFCQVKQIDGLTEWLASVGLVGTNVAGQVGTCCGAGWDMLRGRF